MDGLLGLHKAPPEGGAKKVVPETTDSTALTVPLGAMVEGDIDVLGP